jgi:hypothetical protein
MGFRWLFDGIPCRDQIEGYPARSYGSEFSFEFYFRHRPGQEAEGNHQLRHERAKERLTYAGGGYHDTFEPLSARPLYRDQSPDKSLLVSIALASDETVHDADGHVPTMWGVVVGGDDTTPTDGEPRRLAVDVYYLADVDEFADKAAVRDALAAEGPQ